MKELSKLNTGFFKRNLILAKLATQLGKELFFSSEKEVSNKLSRFLQNKMGALTEDLGQLKGSLLKAGQIISLYGKELLPPEVENLLEQLQSQSSFLSWNQISKQLDPKILEELVISKSPIAAASIGQVHKAIDKETGKKEYALKIQYKNIQRVIDLDLKALRLLLSFTKVVPKDYNLDSIFKEIKVMLLQEMDYEKEANLTLKYASLAGDKYIVPQVFKEFSSKTFICTAFIKGHSIQDEVLNLSQTSRNKLGKDFFELFFKEIFEWNLVQSDAHAGNYLIKDNKWVLLDFGATKELSKEISQDYQGIMRGIARRDKKALWDILEKHNFIDFNHTDEGLLWDYFLLVSEPFTKKYYDWGNSKIPTQALNRSKELLKRVKLNYLPHQNLFIDRKIGGLYFILKTLKVSGDIIPWDYLD